MSNTATKPKKKIVFAERTWSPALHRVTGDGYTRPAMKVNATARRLLDVIMARSRGWTHRVKLSNTEAKQLARLTDRHLRTARRELHDDGLVRYAKIDTRGEVYEYVILERAPHTA